MTNSVLHPRHDFRNRAHVSVCFASFGPGTARRRGLALSDRVCMQATKNPCIILPGLGNNSQDYTSLTAKLEELGHRTFVIPVKRIDWGRNAKGFGMRSYWAGKLEPKSVLEWYFSRIVSTMKLVREEHAGGVNLVGHSAGGWLARVFLGEYHPVDDTDTIRTLVTLGTPHLAPPKGSFDQTRGLLAYVNTRFADVHRKEVSYVCVGGRTLQGKTLGKGTFEEWVAYQSYRPVCGRGDTWGDGITPLDSAFLEGADNIVLEGARHSPVSRGAWYGTDGYIDEWVHKLS
mmetsp:Transcript_6332/g.19104  ORF Transcript_6332/g.19104 Transcript_6332/m.19104 type:complete len:288 (+) Transcript_6332:246-1109(+)